MIPHKYDTYVEVVVRFLKNSADGELKWDKQDYWSSQTLLKAKTKIFYSYKKKNSKRVVMGGQ